MASIDYLCIKMHTIDNVCFETISKANNHVLLAEERLLLPDKYIFHSFILSCCSFTKVIILPLTDPSSRSQVVRRGNFDKSLKQGQLQEQESSLCHRLWKTHPRYVGQKGNRTLCII